MKNRTVIGKALCCTLLAVSFSLINLLSTAAPNMVQAEDVSSSQVPADPIALYKEAGIDEKQQEKVLALANQYEEAQDKKAHEMIAHLKNLRALSLVPDLDEKQILETQTDINKLQSEMALDRMHLLINIRKLLNHDQRVKLVQLMQQARSKGIHHSESVGPPPGAIPGIEMRGTNHF
jgi:hypothetical protein